MDKLKIRLQKMRDLQELRHRKAIEFFHKYQKNLSDSKRLIFKIEQTKTPSNGKHNTAHDTQNTQSTETEDDQLKNT